MNVRNVLTPERLLEVRAPAELVDRFDPDLDLGSLGILARTAGEVVEVRRMPLERREDSETGELVVDGFAAVYETEYDVAGGPPFGWTEILARGAARKTLSEREQNVAFLFDHEGIPLARSESGTLRLFDESAGLRVEARLDRSSPHGLSVIRAIERGDVDEMSIGFRVVRQDWNKNYTYRRILELRLYDVSAVSFGANPATVIQSRSSRPTADDEARAEGGLSVMLARELHRRAHSPA